MNIRKSVLAGSWYQANPDLLRETIDRYFAGVKLPEGIDREQGVAGLVVPHAGHQYSGSCAAYGYSLLKGKSYKRVIIMGPSHRQGFSGVSVSQATHYETPLGLVPVDRTACDKLLQDTGLFSYQAVADKNEHSVEIQLPFLQSVLPDSCKIVPLVVGELDDLPATASAIKGIVDNDTLVIASSDFTHYGEDFGYVPFTDSIKTNLKKLDSGAIDQIVSLSADGFGKYIKSTGSTVCGYKPILLLLSILDKRAIANSKGVLLNYYTSGDLSGDYAHCVSYAAIAFMKSGTNQAPEAVNEDELNEPEKATLLRLARQTIREYLRDKKTPRIDDRDLTSRLKEKRGVFVTLKKRGQLRGCIGSIFNPKALYVGVVEQSVNSAVNDWRFEPMTADEEPDIDIEISVMSPMKKVAGYRDIVVGKHGVYLIKGSANAVFLPQVAPEQGWTRDEMLNQLALKAGLPADAWKTGAEFLVFTAQVFGEHDK